MREARDHFGRRFADLPGDSWSIDTGAFPVITPEGKYVPPSGGEVRYGHKGGIAPNVNGIATTFGSDAAAISSLTRGARFAPPRSFTCQSIGLMRTAGNQVGDVCLGIYDAAGNLLYKKQKNALWNVWGAGAQPIALTIDPFSFDAAEVYYIAARSTANLAAYAITTVGDFRVWMMFQDTLPPNANASANWQLPYTEVLQTTGGGVVAAPDLSPTIAGWASGIQFVQAVGGSPLFWLREEPGNIT